MNLKERFWSKVDKSQNCWVWTAQKHHRDNYGHFKVKGKPVRAHRMSYELTYGPIPDKLGVCHTCDNPPCVRPDHLFLGTQVDNLQDASKKGRLKGLGTRKLTEDQVIAILKDTRIQREIAKEYNISQHHISMIKLKRCWKHVRSSI